MSIHENLRIAWEALEAARDGLRWAHDQGCSRHRGPECDCNMEEYVGGVDNAFDALADARAEAEAGLIAAAPDMLRALKRIFVPGELDEAHGEICETDPCILCEAAHVIAKAEGK